MNLSRRSIVRGLAPLTLALVSRPAEASSAPPGGPRQLPNVLLTTHQGRRVRFYDDLIRNRIAIINFMYADCTGICPGMTANLVRLHRTLGDRVGRDIFMYSFTLKPRHDTPAALAAYARMHGVGAGWLFLTGGPQEIDQVRRKLGFADSDPVADRDLTNHAGLVLIGNDALDRWSACPALAEVSELVKLVSWMEPIA